MAQKERPVPPTGGKAPRGRPRSEASERAIIDAVVSLLEEGIPLAGLSIERIARTARVGKATIYRRWDGKEALLVDVLRSVEEPDRPVPGTSTREDMVALLEGLRRRGVASQSSALLRSVLGQMHSYPQLWQQYQDTVIAARRKALDEVVRRGIERGEIRDDFDFDLAGDLLIGPILVRTVLRPDGSLEEGMAERIVDAVLDGLRPRPRP